MEFVSFVLVKILTRGKLLQFHHYSMIVVIVFATRLHVAQSGQKCILHRSSCTTLYYTVPSSSMYKDVYCIDLAVPSSSMYGSSMIPNVIFTACRCCST